MSDNSLIKLLFIEENKDNQEAFKELVKNKGLPYNYTISDSIKKALKLIDNRKFDIIVTNAILRNGTATELLNIAETTPIIYITRELEDLPIVIEKIVNKDSQRSSIVSNEMLHKYKTINSAIGLQEAIHGLVFHLSKLGPTLTYTTKPKSSVFGSGDYIRIGNFFYIAVGQGNERNFGLYELPVPGYSDFRSFVYAFEVLDPNNEDPRSDGRNYCLLVILFPKWIREFLPHPFELEMIVRENFLHFKVLDDLKKPDLFNQILPAMLRIV